MGGGRWGCFVVCPLPPAARRSWCSSSVWPYQYQAWEWGTANEVPHPKKSLSLSHLFALPRACHQGVLKDPPPGVPPHCLVNKVIFHVCFSSPFYYINEALSHPLLYKSCPLLYKESVPVKEAHVGVALPRISSGSLWFPMGLLWSSLWATNVLERFTWMGSSPLSSLLSHLSSLLSPLVLPPLSSFSLACRARIGVVVVCTVSSSC